MSERCPTCGEPVKVVTGDEGTSHFQSNNAERATLALGLAARAIESFSRVTKDYMHLVRSMNDLLIDNGKEPIPFGAFQEFAGELEEKYRAQLKDFA